MFLPDVQTFLAVASAGSLSAAARQLDVVPMQVSRRIAALEEDLGVRLFHRTTRSLTLTAEGEAFVPFGERDPVNENPRHAVHPAEIRILQHCFGSGFG